jgi:pilus assembly protein Flp/PilA
MHFSYRDNGESKRVNKMEEREVKQLIHGVTTLLEDELGQGLIEYALIAGLIGLAAVLAMTVTGSQISAAFNSISNTLASAI